MIYMRNITITTAKSATYLENVGGYPFGYSSQKNSVEPILLKRTVAGTNLLDSHGAQGMSGCPLLTKSSSGWRVSGVYLGAEFPEAMFVPGLVEENGRSMLPLGRWLDMIFIMGCLFPESIEGPTSYGGHISVHIAQQIEKLSELHLEAKAFYEDESPTHDISALDMRLSLVWKRYYYTATRKIVSEFFLRHLPDPRLERLCIAGMGLDTHFINGLAGLETIRTEMELLLAVSQDLSGLGIFIARYLFPTGFDLNGL